MAEGTVQTIEIDATAAEIYRVAAAVEAYPSWALGVKAVEMLEADDSGLPIRASFVVSGFVKEIKYVLRYEHDVPRRMQWVAEPSSDLKLLEGSYEFKDLPDGRTSVVYALRAQLGFPLPGYVRRQAERQIVGTALRGLKKKVEAEAKD